MKTQVPAPAGPPAGGAPAPWAGPSRRRRALAVLGGAGALAAVVAVVIPFYASTYAAHRFTEPLGWDTPKYLWKTSLASEVGVASLPDRLPPPVNGSPDRPAFAVVALVAGRVLGVSPVRVAEALPVAMAAAIGLACCGLASVGFGLRRWESAVVGASVGASVWVARMAGPETYQDNLMVAAVLLAVAALAAGAAARGRGLVAPALLLGGAALVHWSFALLFAGILVVAALVLVRGSWRGWRREGVPVVRTPSGGLLAVAGGGAATGVAALYGALGAGVRTPKTSPQARVEYEKKAAHDLGRYMPWLTVPGVVVGAVASWRDGDGRRPEAAARRRVTAAVLAAWAGVAVAAAVLAAAGATVPTHRFLAFALPVPIVYAAGAVVLPRVLGRRWHGAGRAAGVVLAVGLLAGAAVAAQAFWSGVRPQVNAELDRQVRAARASLDHAGVAADTPVVFVANAHGSPGVAVALFAHTIRAALPAERVGHAFMYLGDPVSYLAGRPTIVRPVTLDVAEYDGTSWRYFRDVRPLLRGGARPVALLLGAANPDHRFLTAWARSHPESSPGVWVVAGPPGLSSSTGVGAPAPEPIDAGSVAWSALGLLLMAGVAGSGWVAAARARRSWFGAAALAPGAGVAVVVAAGVVADRAGIRLGSGGGLAVFVLAAAAGWAVAVLSGGLRPDPEADSDADAASTTTTAAATATVPAPTATAEATASATTSPRATSTESVSAPTESTA